MKALLGTKIGMTQIIDKNGVMIPVTLIQAGPITVTQIKVVDTDGYNAIQVAYGTGKNLNKSVVGQTKAAKVMPKYIREIRLSQPSDLKVGDVIDLSDFEIGDKVSVSGTSKGKGFAGTVKRYNFNTSRHTHGGQGNVRKPGSIGSMYPQKIFKGKKMAGRMGHDKVTVKNLLVAYIDKDNNLLGVRGAVPGPRKGLVTIGGDK